jgi:glucosamine--fructose-6-phosphate aminotransferase (isomerizing)
VIIASEGTTFPAALHTIEVPAVHPELGFVLSAMAGHLFGYEAALAIDAQARPLREVRAAIETVASAATVTIDPMVELRPKAASAAAPFLSGLRSGSYNGHLEAATAVRLVQLLGYTTGALPIEAYEAEYGKVGTPSALIADLTDALTDGIDELTRPIDAIKHQAKTVTVGISRSEDALLTVPLVAETLTAGAPRDRLSYRALRTLAALDAAVEEVVGWTRYRIEGTIADRTATIHVLDKGGIARDIPSRTDTNPVLRGIKHRAAEEREVTVGVGGGDLRSLILVPEVKDNQPTGMTLLHVRFAETLPAGTMRQVLQGYRNRYAAIVDAVTELQPSFDDTVLGKERVIDILSVPVHVLAQRWRKGP